MSIMYCTPYKVSILREDYEPYSFHTACRTMQTERSLDIDKWIVLSSKWNRKLQVIQNRNTKTSF